VNIKQGDIYVVKERDGKLSVKNTEEVLKHCRSEIEKIAKGK